MGRYGKGLLALFVGIVLFSIAGLSSVAAILAPPLLIGIVLFGMIPSARPGARSSFRSGRKARKINYLGHYDDPLDAVGHAIVLVFAVGEIAEPFHFRFGLAEALLVFLAALAAGWLPEFIADIGREVISGLAVVALVARILVLPSDGALASKVIFGVAVLITGVVLIGAWNLPRVPVLMFKRGNRARLTACFALLELAATLAFPVGAEGGGSPIDVWAGSDVDPLTLGAAIFFFTIVAVATAYGPRFVTGLIGIALALVQFYFQGFNYLILTGA